MVRAVVKLRSGAWGKPQDPQPCRHRSTHASRPTPDVTASRHVFGLDLIRALKKRSGKTVLLVEHKMDVVRELADRIVVLHNGAMVADGEPETVIALPVVQQAYLGLAPTQEAA